MLCQQIPQINCAQTAFISPHFCFCCVSSSFRISTISGMFSLAKEAQIDHTFLNLGIIKKCAPTLCTLECFACCIDYLWDCIQKLYVRIAGSSFCRGASLPDGAFKQVMFLFTFAAIESA